MNPLTANSSDLHSIHLENTQQFERYRTGIQALLAEYQHLLLDDFSLPEKSNPATLNLSGWLTENTHSCLPWLWVLTDPQQTIYALAALNPVIPGRHGYLHGISSSRWPATLSKQASITRFAQEVLQAAFALGDFHKIKAEFEADNWGARGFCLRMGFRREARFKQDNRIAGQWRDVLVFSLFQEHFEAQFSAVSPNPIAE